jgi:hypothetical protein
MNDIKTLPARPSLEYLKKLAKQQSAAMRRRGEKVSLAEAQLKLARSYGFSSWRKLKAHIDAIAAGVFEKVMRAITKRDHQALSRLLAAAPGVVNQTGPHPRWGGRPQPIHVAIESGDREAFEVLLNAGANVDGDNRHYDGWSPVMIAIHSKRVEMRDELIRRGAAVGLIEALMMGDDRRVAILLKDPAVLRGPFPNGGTPLHFARTVKAARLLLSQGVSIEAKDKYGKTAPQSWADVRPVSAGLMRLADSIGMKPAWDIFKTVEHGELSKVRKLVTTREEANARFPDGSRQTLLHAAAWNGDLAMTKLLVSKGADVFAVDHEHNNTAAGFARYALASFQREPCRAVAEYLEGLMKRQAVQDQGTHRLPDVRRGGRGRTDQAG